MQLCNCEVRLGGSVSHTVLKQEVTPAEIIVLQAIHGSDAVIGIQPTHMDKRSHITEWERLQQNYGRPTDGLVDAGNGNLLEKLFPGAQKNLPVTLKDIGLGHLMNPSTRAKASDAGEAADEE